MKRPAIVVCACLLAAAVGISQSAARLSEMRTSKGVEPKLQSPIDVTETFSPEPQPVYITAKLLDAPPGTQVRIDVRYVEKGDEQIAAHDFPDISGTGYFSFRLNSPPAGWPVGKYRVFFYLNGKEHGGIGFAVVPGKATPGHPEYRTFTSSQYGFNVQYPAKWVEGEKGSPSVACMFLANPDNDPVASLNVQVVPVNNADSSQAKEAVDLVAQQLIDQINKSFKGRIRGDTWASADGKTGRELDSEYPYKGKSIRQRQFLTFHGDKVFVVIYTVESDIYGTYISHYAQATKTLNFSDK